MLTKIVMCAVCGKTMRYDGLTLPPGAYTVVHDTCDACKAEPKMLEFFMSRFTLHVYPDWAVLYDNVSDHPSDWLSTLEHASDVSDIMAAFVAAGGNVVRHKEKVNE